MDGWFFLIIIFEGFLFVLNHKSDEQVPREAVEPLSTETFKTPLDGRSSPLKIVWTA